MSDLDDRLRTALTGLGADAERRIKPAGSHTVPPAGRRRRWTARAATATLALVLVGTAASAWWVTGSGGERGGGPKCVPGRATAFLPPDATYDHLQQMSLLLAASPEVESVEFESKTEAYDRFKALYSDPPQIVPNDMRYSWQFTVACAREFRAVRDRLAVVPGAEVVCACDPRATRPPTTGPPTASRSR